jgi:hypothetical protein
MLEARIRVAQSFSSYSSLCQNSGRTTGGLEEIVARNADQRALWLLVSRFKQRNTNGVIFVNSWTTLTGAGVLFLYHHVDLAVAPRHEGGPSL